MFEKPIFIIGLHRSGSTLMKNMLNLNSELAMAIDEMYIQTPWHKDFMYFAGRAGNLKVDYKLKEFIEKIFLGYPYGSFWEKINDINIDRNAVYEKVKLSSRTPREIVQIILEEFALSEGKSRYGVKYPVHFSKIHLLNEWWKDCKILHLFRDPRAICVSKVNDTATKYRKSKYPKLKQLIHFNTQFFFVLEFIWSCNIYSQYKNSENYMMIRFEDIISNPENSIKEICHFCELNYESAMLHPYGKPSSYDSKLRYGFDQKATCRWKESISSFEKKWITFLTGRSMKSVGY